MVLDGLGLQTSHIWFLNVFECKMMEHLDMNQHEPAKMEVNQLQLEETGPHLKMEDFRKREDQSWDCSQEEENALHKVNASPD